MSSSAVTCPSSLVGVVVTRVMDCSLKWRAVDCGPLVVLFDQDCSVETQECLGIGKDADDVGPTFGLLVDSLKGFGRPYLSPVDLREAGESQQVILRLAQPRLVLR